MAAAKKTVVQVDTPAASEEATNITFEHAGRDWEVERAILFDQRTLYLMALVNRKKTNDGDRMEYLFQILERLAGGAGETTLEALDALENEDGEVGLPELLRFVDAAYKAANPNS